MPQRMKHIEASKEVGSHNLLGDSLRESQMNENKIVTGSREFAEDIINTVREPLMKAGKPGRTCATSRYFTVFG